MAKKELVVSFDELNRVRLLNPKDFKDTETLAEECGHFVEKISTFTKTTQSLVDVLKAQSEKIEREKLLAIGQWNRIQSETELRKRRQQELQYLIAQKQAELQRLSDHHQSLVKVEAEQKAQIEKLAKQ